MAYKKDTRKRVKILKSNDSYLIGMIGRLESINNDIYSVMIGPYIKDFNKEDLEFI